MKIGILGSNGFLGSFFLNKLSKNNDVVGITKKNYNEFVGQSFDIFINAAGNKKSYLANKDPYGDFVYSTLPVYKSFYDFNINKYVYISSIAVNDTGSFYGFNKLVSEDIIKKNSNNYVIIRCCGVIDKSLDMGLVYDIINDKESFLTSNSKIQLISRSELSEIIKLIIDKGFENSTINVGGIGSIEVNDIFNMFNKCLKTSKDALNRNYELDVTFLNNFHNLKTTKQYIIEEYCK